jgi:hypothetical protein
MLSRRAFLERASWGLLTLGGADDAIAQSTGLHVFYDPAIRKARAASTR